MEGCSPNVDLGLAWDYMTESENPSWKALCFLGSRREMERDGRVGRDRGLGEDGGKGSDYIYSHEAVP